MLTVGRRAVTGGSIEIARRVITRLGLSVPQPCRNVTVLRSQARLPAAHACQLVGPGILPVLRGLGAILGCDFAVVDSLGSVVRRLSVRGWRYGAFTFRSLALPRRAVEVARRVVARRGLSVTLLSLSVAHVRGQVAVASFNIPLAGGGHSVLVFSRQSAQECTIGRNKCRNCRCAGT